MKTGPISGPSWPADAMHHLAAGAAVRLMTNRFQRQRKQRAVTYVTSLMQHVQQINDLLHRCVLFVVFVVRNIRVHFQDL